MSVVQVIAILPAECAPAAVTAMGDGVRTVSEGPHTALCMPFKKDKTFKRLGELVVGRTRKKLGQELLSRQILLENLHRHGTTLPVLPDTTASFDALPDILAANRPQLDATFAQVEAAEQVQVQVIWDTAGVLEHFRNTPEVADLRRAGTVSPAGLMRAVGRLRSRLQQDCHEKLHAVSRDIIALPCDPPDAMVLNVSCLIAQRDRLLFDQTLEGIDAIWPAGFRIRQIGPGPAASFASIGLSPRDMGAFAAARELLGVGPRSAVADIRRARRALLLQMHPDRSRSGGSGVTMQEIADAADLLLSLASARTALVQAQRQPKDDVPQLLVRRDAGVSQNVAEMAGWAA